MTGAVPPGGWRDSVARQPLRRRVGVLVALAVGLAVAATALAGYVTVRVQLTSSVDEALLDRARSAVSTSLGDPDRIVRVPAEAVLAADLRVAVINPAGFGRSAFGPASAPPFGLPEQRVAGGEAAQSIRTADLGGQSYRVVAVPAREGLALVLGQPTATVDRVLDRLGLVSLVAGALGIVLAAWAGTAIARAGLRPVERLTSAAEHVAATGRPEPIDVGGAGTDEIGRLTQAFNAMLAALGQAQDRQRRLVADAGHELRTPLTSLRTNLDLLAQADRQGGLDPAERTQLVADVRAQTEELSSLVSDLVELSREGGPALTRQELDLADTVTDAVERVRRRAPGLAFAVSTQPWPVEGDAQLLGRAVTNLLDNAAKWSPPGGTVTVRLHEGTLEVVDEGPGIAERDLPYVFERFYRSDEARALPGSGLGLAIVRSAAERHGGAVRADRADGGGARLRFWVPGSSAVLT